jgi:hypothetical protein
MLDEYDDHGASRNLVELGVIGIIGGVGGHGIGDWSIVM